MEADSMGSAQVWLGCEYKLARVYKRVCVNRSIGSVEGLAEKREKIQQKVVFTELRAHNPQG